MEYELSCRYSTAKSFYGKAIVKETINKNVTDLKLYSYKTLVARITKIGDITTYYYLGHYSATTTRHQKEFFKQNGLADDDIKKLVKEGELSVRN